MRTSKNGLCSRSNARMPSWYRPEVDPVQAAAGDGYIPLLAGPLGELTFLLYDFYIGPYVSLEELAAYHAAWERPRAKISMNNWYRANVYPELKTPTNVVLDIATLTLWGERDEMVTTSEIDYLPDFVPDLRVVRLDADHWFPLKMPERVMDEVLQFEQTLDP